MGVRLWVVPEGASETDASAGSSCELDQDRFVIGRAASADLRLPDASVSARHCSIRVEGPRYVLVDHTSTNGTRVNDQPVVAERPKVLRDGDWITIGVFRVRFHAGVPVSEPSSRERTASLARRLSRAASGASAAPAQLVVLNGETRARTLVLPDPPARVVMGRAESADLPLPDADASREHAEVLVDLDGALLRDLGSKNGVLVNEKRVSEKRLRDRDQITIGATIVLYEDPSEARLASLEAEPDRALPPPTRVSPPIMPETEPAAVAPEPPREPDRPLAPPPVASGLSNAELFVIGLALAVLVASLAGLYVLMR
jgi:pSer/pThr/pTyr-binding forkhead associated (FHA) protein